MILASYRTASPNPPHGRCCFSASLASASWPIVASQRQHRWPPDQPTSDQPQGRLLGRPFATRGDFRVWQIVLQKSQNARRQIFRQGRNKRQSAIDVLSIASPRLPVSSSLVDVVPHMII